GRPALLRLGNIWLTINVGGGPTDDKPEVVATPPKHPNELTIFLNLRVTDINRFYERCRARGAAFITEPKTHTTELRCYMRDPDGYLIEVGQTTVTKTPLEMYRERFRITLVELQVVWLRWAAYRYATADITWCVLQDAESVACRSAARVHRFRAEQGNPPT